MAIQDIWIKIRTTLGYDTLRPRTIPNNVIDESTGKNILEIITESIAGLTPGQIGTMTEAQIRDLIAQGSFLTYAGVVSATDPTGTMTPNPSTPNFWYQSSDTTFPTTFPLAVKSWNFTTSAWVDAQYSPTSGDVWSNLNVAAGQPNGAYWFSGEWNQLDFHIDLSPYRTAAAQNVIDAGKAPVNMTLTDAAADTTLPDTAATALTAILQTVRSNLKALFSYFTAGVANAAAKLNTARTIDGVPFDGSAAITHYTNCATAAATAAKTTGTITGFVLAAGARVSVMFTNGNTAASPTLSVSGTAAAAIRCYGAAVTADHIPANWLAMLEYDGTYWQLINPKTTTRSTTVSLAAASWTGSAAPYTYTITTTAIRVTPTSYHMIELNTTDQDVRKAVSAFDIQEYDAGQAANTVVLRAYGTKPNIAIPIMIWEL